MIYDAFLSYAGEDTQFASEIVGGLKSNGFAIWYAPLNLKVGDKLLDSIEQGMSQSRTGILLISKNYLVKGWTNYEMDTFIREYIESGKKILPIWVGVQKEEVATRHSGLAGIVALNASIGHHNLVSKLCEVLAQHAPSRGVIPSWESPIHRFLQGEGEINLGTINGPATTLWEFIIHAKDNEYPLFLGGQVYSKDDLLFQAAQLLPHVPEEAVRWVGKDGKDNIWRMCVKAGYDPKDYA